MSQRTYRAKVDTDYGRRGVVHKGFEAVFPDAAPPDPAVWEPLDGVWPEVKLAEPPHWTDSMPGEVVAALRTFETPDDALRVLSMGMAVVSGMTPDGATETAAPEGQAAQEPAPAATGATETANATPGRATPKAKPGAKA